MTKVWDLTGFKPREYQKPILRALDDGRKRVLAVMPRRAGKDVTALNYMIKQMYQEAGVYYYIFPSYAQAKKVIWDSQTNDGQKILNFFPQELVLKCNQQEMKILMRTEDGRESLFQLLGSDNYDSLVGTNPRGVVFSEYALQDPMAYSFLRPILTANQGWALFISTPRGRNHLWELYRLAQGNPEWFCYRLTVDDTQHIPISDIEKEREAGEMSDELIQQEYYTSFSRGVEGSYYAKYLDQMRRDARISRIPWRPDLLVHTSWDLGCRDATCVLFFQMVGRSISIIDSYSATKEGLEHFAGVVRSKPYEYGTHIAPHDIKVQEFSTGITRLQKAHTLGLPFVVSERKSVEDGIEAVRTLFPRLWIDARNCAEAIRAFECYHQLYDPKKRVYYPRPFHDWASNYADALRYLASSLELIEDPADDGPEQLEKSYKEALEYGRDPELPAPFDKGFDLPESPWRI